MAEHYDEVSIRHRRWQDDPNRVPVFSIVHPNPDYEAQLAAWNERKADHERTQPTEMAATRVPFGEPEPERDVHTTYDMPASPNGGLALAYLKQLRVIGQAAAAGWLIEQAIGSDAYDAISAEPDIDMSTIMAVAGRIQSVALGAFSDASAPKV